MSAPMEGYAGQIQQWARSNLLKMHPVFAETWCNGAATATLYTLLYMADTNKIPEGVARDMIRTTCEMLCLSPDRIIEDFDSFMASFSMIEEGFTP